MGWLILSLLTAFAALDAVGVALLTRPSGRAELGMTSMTFFFALLAAPVLVLGYAGHLTRASLALAALVLFAAVFLVAWRVRRGGLRAHFSACAAGAQSLARLPADALGETWRAKSLAGVGLAWCAIIIGAAAILTWLVAFDSWDGFYYHEPIVGYAIQNHGFAFVPLPPNFAVAATNGYPRLGESLSLWFCTFTDRTLIELPSTLVSPGLVLAVFALARRFTDRVTAMGWAAVLFLMPHAWHLVCSTYIDGDLAFFALVATYYATRPPRARVRDALLASLGMAMIVGTKGSGLLWVPPIALLAYGRLARQLRARPWAVLGSAVLGGLLVAGTAAVTLVRNYRKFKDPLWPMTYENKALRIHWPGLVSEADLFPRKPLEDTVHTFYDPPHGGMEDVIQRGYGTAVVWVVVPLAALATVLVACALLLALVRWRRPSPLVVNLSLLLAPAIIGLRTTPSIEQPRYNMHIIATAVVACAWLLRGRAWLRVREGVTAVAVALSLLQFFWLKDALPSSAEELEERLGHPFAPRAYKNTPSIDLLSRERYQQIRAGDRVAYDENLAFPGDLWNFDFSNHVEYVPFTTEPDYLARIDAYDPKWVCVGGVTGGGSGAQTALVHAGSWVLVGRLDAPHEDYVWRRK